MFDLDFVKKHLNIDKNFTDDDIYLEQLAIVAIDIIEKHLNVSIGKLSIEYANGDIPTTLQHAILLLIGHLYNNREATTYSSATELPLGYTYILDLYKNYYNPNNE